MAVPGFPLSELRPELRTRNEAACRALCNSVYLGDYFGVLRILCRVLGRYKMYVDPNDHGLSPHLILDGFWEMPTTEAIAQLVSPGMVVADIGANLGYFSLLMGELVGPSGKVYAFEPNPAMAFRLERSARLNGMGDRVLRFEVALGDENEKMMSFLMPTDEPKNAYVTPFEGEELTGAVFVTSQRLDSKGEWHDIELVKIDAEGSEERILSGMQLLLEGEKLKTIIMEVRMSRYADGRGFLRKILDYGFSIARVDDGRGIVEMDLDGACNYSPDEDMMLVFRR